MDYIDTIEHLPLHSRFRIMIITRYVYSKLRWHLTVNEIDSTWIKANLDSLVLRFVRKWLQLHPGANTDHLRFTTKKVRIGPFTAIWYSDKLQTHSPAYSDIIEKQWYQPTLFYHIGERMYRLTRLLRRQYSPSRKIWSPVVIRDSLSYGKSQYGTGLWNLKRKTV